MDSGAWLAAVHGVAKSRTRLSDFTFTFHFQASLSITNSRSSLRLRSIESVMPSSHLILCRPLLLPPLPPSIRVFSNESNSSHEVAKVLEFQLQHHSFQRTPKPDLLQNGLVGSPYSPRDSQEPSPTPQFKSINSYVLSFLHPFTSSQSTRLRLSRNFCSMFSSRNFVVLGLTFKSSIHFVNS